MNDLELPHLADCLAWGQNGISSVLRPLVTMQGQCPSFVTSWESSCLAVFPKEILCSLVHSEMITGKKDVSHQIYSLYDNRAKRRVLTLVSHLRKTSSCMFICSKLRDLEGAWSPEEHEILKELTENEGPQREPPHSVIHLLTLWLQNEHLVSASLTYFFPSYIPVFTMKILQQCLQWADCFTGWNMKSKDE